MSEYNPIVRTFNAIRAAIVAHAGVPRHRVRPSAAIEDLIPPERRRAVWAELRRRGLDPPWLELPPAGGWVRAAAFVLAVPPALAWLGPCVTLAAAGPALLGCHAVTRPWATNIAIVRTVGQLTASCTRFADHRASGYRPSRGDIALKVRLIVAGVMGVPLDHVREENTFTDLGAW